jgi:hypothetical protein
LVLLLHVRKEIAALQHSADAQPLGQLMKQLRERKNEGSSAACQHSRS